MKKICLALALSLLPLSNRSDAAQILYQESPTEATSATISRTEPNLVKVDGRKIKRIFGAEGLFTVTPEPDTGVAWLKPMTDKPLMSAFITDDDGQHYKLLLKVEDIPAETIIIKSRHTKSASMSAKNEPRNDEILRAILSLHDGEGDTKNQTVPLWQGTKFELLRVLSLRGLRGEIYLLSNTSNKQIVIDEREFYRDGVEAVSTEKPILEAGESTLVYIINSEDE